MTNPVIDRQLAAEAALIRNDLAEPQVRAHFRKIAADADAALAEEARRIVESAEASESDE